MNRLVRSLAFGLLCLPPVLAGCTARGGRTPEGTFELGRQYVEAGQYGKIWGLFSRRYKGELTEMFDRQKSGVSQAMESGTNLDMTEEVIRAQYGLGAKEFLAATAEELHARMIEGAKDRVEALRVKGEPRVEGDRALVVVAPPEKGAVPVTFVLIRQNDRWLIDGVDGMTGANGPGLPPTGR